MPREPREMNDLEKSIAKEIRMKIGALVEYERAYTDKRSFQNLIRIKFFNIRSTFREEFLRSHITNHIFRPLERDFEAYFLAPKFFIGHTYRRDVWCLSIYFNV